MDYMKESDQVRITQITTAIVFCVMLAALSIFNAFHSNSPLTVGAYSVLAIAAITGFAYCARKIGESLDV